MSALKKRIIPSDWEEEDGYCLAVFCFPNSRDWRSVITGLVADMYYGRTWDGKTGSIVETQQIGRDIYGSLCIMCMEDVSAAINNVADAIRNQTFGSQTQNSDCGEFVCINTNTINEDGTDEAPAIPGDFGPGDEEPPEGFETMEDYLQYKCEVANLIFDGVTRALRTIGVLSALQAVGQVVAGYIIAATAASAIILPPLAFVGLVALIVAVLFAGLSTLNFMYNMADEMDANREEIVCRLYSAKNTTEAVESVLDVVSGLISVAIAAAGLTGGLAATASTFLGTFLGSLISNDTVNQLFTLVANLSYAGADCSGCGETDDCPFYFTFGSGTPKYDGQTWSATSEDVGGGVHVLEMLMVQQGDCDESNWCVRFISRTSMNDTSANYTRKLYSNANNVYGYNFEDFDWNSDPADCFPDVNTREYPIEGFTFASNGSFVIEMKLIKKVVATDFDPTPSPACD